MADRIPEDQRRRGRGTRDEKEPKVKWQHSKAKQLLRKDILEGRVPLEARDAHNRTTMALRQIYNLHPEVQEYFYSKFSQRLGSLRTTIKEEKKRKALDQEAFDNFIQNHPSRALLSKKGYIQWQGSEAQKLLLDDIAANRHTTMSKSDLYGSRREYYENFPLDVFRDKLSQEIRTARYLHTLRVKGKDPRKKK